MCVFSPITALPQLYMLGTPVHEGDENAQLSVNEVRKFFL